MDLPPMAEVPPDYAFERSDHAWVAGRRERANGLRSRRLAGVGEPAAQRGR
jgi:hypothetical protein